MRALAGMAEVLGRAVRAWSRSRGESPSPDGPHLWGAPSYDAGADINRQIGDAEEQQSAPVIDPERYERCEGLIQMGLCARHMPIGRHRWGNDAWWHPKPEGA